MATSRSRSQDSGLRIGRWTSGLPDSLRRLPMGTTHRCRLLRNTLACHGWHNTRLHLLALATFSGTRSIMHVSSNEVRLAIAHADVMIAAPCLPISSQDSPILIKHVRSLDWNGKANLPTSIQI